MTDRIRTMPKCVDWQGMLVFCWCRNLDYDHYTMFTIAANAAAVDLASYLINCDYLNKILDEAIETRLNNDLRLQTAR